MSLIDSRSVATFLFDEQNSLPKDSSRTVADLSEGTNTEPEIVELDMGRARRFSDSLGTVLETVDGDDDLVVEDVTIIALLALDATAQFAAGNGTIVHHARNPNISAFALRLLPTSATTFTVALGWQQIDGTNVADSGVEIQWLDDDVYLIAAIREADGDGYTVRYVINGTEFTGDSTDFDVGRSSGAELTIGAEPVNPSGYGNNLCGDLIALEILGEAVASEEIQHLWQRLSIDCPQQSEMHRKLVPPGVYSTDPDSDIQRELDVEGAAFGLLRSVGRELREYGLPAKAFGERFKQWESLAGYSPKATDSIATRRGRVGEHFASQFSTEESEILAQVRYELGSDVEDLEVIRYSPLHTAALASFDDHGIRNDGAGLWSDGSTVNFGATGQDIRFTGRANAKAGTWLYSLSGQVGFTLGVDFIGNTNDPGSFAGVVVGSKITNEWLLVGSWNDGGTIRYATMRYTDKTLGDPVEISAGSNDFSVLVRHRGEGVYGIRLATTRALAEAAEEFEYSGGPETPDWIGPIGTAEPGTSSPDIDIDLTDLALHQPEGGEQLGVFIFRDPANPGEYDLDAANRRLRSITPVWGDVLAIDQRQLLATATTNGTFPGREPLRLP